MGYRPGTGTVAAAILGSLALAASAEASQTVTAASSVARPCHRDIASSATGRQLVRTKARARSIVSARLSSGGDWDLAIFGAKGRLVAGSAGFAGNELAGGFVRKGERLTVQACRYPRRRRDREGVGSTSPRSPRQARARSKWST